MDYLFIPYRIIPEKGALRIVSEDPLILPRFPADSFATLMPTASFLGFQIKFSLL